MAKETRTTARSDDLRPSREDWGHLLSVGSVVAAVLFVLILGAALRVGPTEAGAYAADPVPEAAEWVPHELPLDDDLPAAPVPQAADPAPDTASEQAPPPAAARDPLVARSAADLRRLAASGRPWTAQLAVLCDRDRVLAQVARFGSDDRFHVLPVALDGRECFRFCWGSFGDADAARAAAGLPAGLRDLSPRPIPKRTAEVVR